MEIQTETQSIHVSRLYKMMDYSKVFNLPLSTVNYQMLTGKLPTIKISNIRFVIASDEDMISLESKDKGGK